MFDFTGARGKCARCVRVWKLHFDIIIAPVTRARFYNSYTFTTRALVKSNFSQLWGVGMWTFLGRNVDFSRSECGLFSIRLNIPTPQCTKKCIFYFHSYIQAHFSTHKIEAIFQYIRFWKLICWFQTENRENLSCYTDWEQDWLHFPKYFRKSIWKSVIF